jgi:thiamine pyrophosphokinase
MEHAIVLADGEPPTIGGLNAAWPGWDDGVDRVIAADGGARHADRLALRIDLWVGDGDSILPIELEALRSAGVEVDLVPAEKDESDTELAVVSAALAGAKRITILGALGGPRFDHSFANVALLAHAALVGIETRILADDSRLTLLSGPAEAELRGHAGDLVSLLPFGGDVDGVVTSGLRYPLRRERLIAGLARGLSNVRLEDVASVGVNSGRLLVVETPATLRT